MENGRVIKAGYLFKSSTTKWASLVRKRWRQRWFVLYAGENEEAELHYFESSKQAMRACVSSGCIRKQDVKHLGRTAQPQDKQEHVLLLQTEDKEIYIASPTADELHAWHVLLAQHFSHNLSLITTQWEFMSDKADWVPYLPDATSHLEHMQSRGVASFRVEKQLTGTKPYIIHLKEMMQVSPRTGSKRLIRRRFVVEPFRRKSGDVASVCSVSSGKAVLVNRSKSLPVSMRSSTRSDSFESASIGGTSENSLPDTLNGSDEDEFSLLDREPEHVWVWATRDGHWRQYSPESSEQLERTFLDQVPFCLLDIATRRSGLSLRRARQNNTYIINFSTWLQINPATGMRREVRRVLRSKEDSLDPPRGVTTVSNVSGLSNARDVEFIPPDWVDGNDEVESLLEGLRHLQVPRQHIERKRLLGQGAFGEVYLGTMFDSGQAEGKMVAVKALQGTDASGQESRLTVEILKEATIMAQFNHPNVVRLLGVCANELPVQLVMEYMNCGDLLHHLRKTRLTLRQQLSIALQVAQAMVYLSTEKNFVHRDLAARNVMVNTENDGSLIAKVTDFGMTRDLYSKGSYRMSLAADKMSEVRLPAKWMALESLEYFVFTTRSDVWSFGVLVWELLTHGQVPYQGVEGTQIYLELMNGLKLERPPGCSQQLYNLILSCCKHFPKERPTFQELRDMLTDFLTTEDLSPTLDLPPRPPPPKSIPPQNNEDWDDSEYTAIEAPPPRPPKPVSLSAESSPLQTEVPQRPPKPVEVSPECSPSEVPRRPPKPENGKGHSTPPPLPVRKKPNHFKATPTPTVQVELALSSASKDSEDESLLCKQSTSTNGKEQEMTLLSDDKAKEQKADAANTPSHEKMAKDDMPSKKASLHSRKTSQSFLELRMKFEALAAQSQTQPPQNKLLLGSQTLVPSRSTEVLLPVSRSRTLTAESANLVTRRSSCGLQRFAARRKPLRSRSASLESGMDNCEPFEMLEAPKQMLKSTSCNPIFSDRLSGSWVLLDSDTPRTDKVEEPDPILREPLTTRSNALAHLSVASTDTTVSTDSSGYMVMRAKTERLSPELGKKSSRHHKYINTPKSSQPGSPIGVNAGDDEEGYAIMGQRRPSEESNGYSLAFDLFQVSSPRTTPEGTASKRVTPVATISKVISPHMAPSTSCTAIADVKFVGDFDRMGLIELQAIAAADDIPFSNQETCGALRERLVRRWKEQKEKEGGGSPVKPPTDVSKINSAAIASRPPLPLPRETETDATVSPSEGSVGSQSPSEQTVEHEGQRGELTEQTSPGKLVGSKPNLPPRPPPILVKQRLAATLSHSHQASAAIIVPAPQDNKRKAATLKDGGSTKPKLNLADNRFRRSMSSDSLGYISADKLDSQPPSDHSRLLALASDITETLDKLSEADVVNAVERKTEVVEEKVDESILCGPHSYLDVGHCPLGENDIDSAVAANLEEELYGNVSTEHLAALMRASELPVTDGEDRDQMMNDLRSAMQNKRETSRGMLIIPAALEKVAQLLVGLVLGLSLPQEGNGEISDVLKHREEWLQQRDQMLAYKEDLTEGYSIAADLKPWSGSPNESRLVSPPINVPQAGAQQAAKGTGNGDVESGSSRDFSGSPNLLTTPSPDCARASQRSTKVVVPPRAWLPRKVNKAPDDKESRKTSKPGWTKPWLKFRRKTTSTSVGPAAVDDKLAVPIIRCHSDEDLKKCNQIMQRRTSKDDSALEDLRRQAAQPTSLPTAENFYLQPTDENYLDGNFYAAVDYGLMSPPSKQSTEIKTLSTILLNQPEEQHEDYYTPMQLVGSVSSSLESPVPPASHQSGGSMLIDEDYLPMSVVERAPSALSEPPPSTSYKSLRLSASLGPASDGNRREVIWSPDVRLTKPKAYVDPQDDLDAEAYSVMPLKDQECLQVSRVEPEAYVIHSLDDDPSDIALADIQKPEDVARLSVNKLKALLRVNSVKYNESASHDELVAHAEALWSRDAYLPADDLHIPRLEALTTEAAVRALSADQLRAILQVNNHDGATDMDENLLVQHVLDLWKKQFVPARKSAPPSLDIITPQKVDHWPNDQALNLLNNHRHTDQQPQQGKERVWKLRLRRPAFMPGSTEQERTKKKSSSSIQTS